MSKATIEHKCDVLVIGGGASGSLAAIRAKEFGLDVLLVDKVTFGRGGCAALASGALGVYLPGDSIEIHLKGRGDLIDQRMAIKSIQDSYDVYRRLEEYGVPFVREKGELWRKESTGTSGALQAGLLGGGPAMMLAVRRAVLERGIRVLNRIMVTDLLTSDGKLPTQGGVIGAIGLDTRTGEIHVFRAKGVAMCAGGYNFPYPKSPGQPLGGMPINQSSDGHGALLRAGATMGNLAIGGQGIRAVEFFTAPGLEHLSMQGARWVNSKGEVLQEKYASAETSTTRRLTLGISITLEEKAGRGPVYLDCTHFTPDQIRFLWDVLPIFMSNYERAGYDLLKDKVPYLGMAATVRGINYNAGARIDEQGRTNIPGLYAGGSCGDAHVKISAELREAFVIGLWAGEGVAKYAKNVPVQEEVSDEQVESLKNKLLAPLEIQNGIDYDEAYDAVAQTFVELGSVVNTGKLLSALKKVEKFNAEAIDRVGVKDVHYLCKLLSLRNTAQVGEVVLKYLLHRTESRGSVLNEDYPYIDNDNWLKWTYAQLGIDGQLKVWDEEIPEESFVHRKPSRGKKLLPLFAALKEYGQ